MAEAWYQALCLEPLPPWLVLPSLLNLQLSEQLGSPGSNVPEKASDAADRWLCLPAAEPPPHRISQLVLGLRGCIKLNK